jgi:hypothetical protein
MTILLWMTVTLRRRLEDGVQLMRLDVHNREMPHPARKDVV